MVDRGAFLGPVRHVYVHVPFCRAKCDYCDFASSAVGLRPSGGMLDEYEWTPEWFAAEYPLPIIVRPTRWRLG